MKKITFLLLALASLSLPAQNIVINEVVTSNSTINTDEDGSYQDWIELYNNGPAAVNLNGYGLTDDTNLYKWVFPNVTVNPGQFLLVFCSDKNRTVVGQPLHTNWKISSDGETISLTAPGNIPVDVIPATVITQNNSYGRYPDGSNTFSFFTTPTPGSANFSTVVTVLNPPVVSQASGFYTANFNLSITADPGATILYTLDGSEPDENNLLGTTYSYKKSYPENPGDPYGPFFTNSYQTLQYSAPIAISDRTSQPNKLTGISSTYELNPDYFPAYNVYKGTVVRVKATKPGFDPSPVATYNYFISPAGNSRFALPVISLSISEDKLFDYENGIYVAGKLFDDYRTSNPSDILDYPIGNYTQKGSAFERRANLSYFVNGQEMLNQDVGIRVQGDYSRIYPSKSLNVYSSATYGNDFLDYKFFADREFTSFKRVVFKNGGSDFFNSFIKDALCSELIENLHTINEASQPAVTFLNGEYWGMLTIREKYDDKYFKRVFDIPESEVELLENDGLQIEEGDNAHYLAMVNYFENNSLVPEANFDYIKTQMDTDSFTDYFITNIYLNNTDWPGNNIIFWRRNTPFNPNAAYGNDGRWRWAAHDMTGTFANPNHNNLAVATSATGTDWPNPQWSTLQLRKLLENPTFKNDFINRFADVMNTTFLSSRVVAMVNELKAEIASEMPEQMQRWKGPVDLGDWNYFLNLEKTFANNRPNAQRNHIRNEFGIANNINATLNVSDMAHGYVKINTIEIKEGTDAILANPYPWTGIYFSNIPVKITAIAKPGYVFSHWTGDSTSTDAEITITTAANFAVTAVFIPSGFAIETPEPVYFWWMSGAIPNNLPLLALNSSYEVTTDASIQFQSALAGYPFDASNPNWRKASMERRNKPTPINYRLDANGGLPYVAADMKGLQITQPFQDNGLENTMIFNLSTTNYKNIKFSFAAMDESAATGISIDYNVNAGTPVWITSGLAATSLPLTTDTFQLYETDFTTIASANNNPNFKIRLRFTGPDMTTSAGNRVTFNNIAVDGVKLPLLYTSPNVFTVGTPIVDLVPEVAASVNSYSISPGLPSGLSFDTTTGIISGTPTAVTPTASYTVTATNVAGTATYDVVITVNDIAPSDLSYTTPNVYTVSTAIADLTPTITGNATSYSVSPALPDGLDFDTTTGIISGTPTALTATATYTVTATNSGGNTTFDVEITVNDVAPSDLSYTTPNIFTVGTSITDLVPIVIGSVDSYSVSSALPDGLDFDATTGIISGTPTALTATATYTVTATNSGGNTTFDVEITVNDIAPSNLSYNTPNVFTVGTSITDLVPIVIGSVDSYSVSSALPDGLDFDTTTGIISGTPTALTATATYTVTATNSGGNTTFDVEITVNDIAPSDLSYNTPNVFTVGTSITDLVPIVTGNATSYSVSPALPDGLDFDTTTGIISGTPTDVTATATYTVTATNSGGNTTFDVEITVNDIAPSDLSYNTPNIFTVGNAIADLTPTITGNVDSYSVSSALPDGLDFDTTTGIISGTPTDVTATATYTVTATNSGGTTTFDVEITVNDIAPSDLSYTTPNVFTVGTSITDLVPIVIGSVDSYSVSPALPNGLALDTTTGIISGTPTDVSGATAYMVTASNSGGDVSFNVIITVNPEAPSGLSYTTPNVFTVGASIADLTPTITGNVTSYMIIPTLPAGLSFDTTTGIISGTPTAVSPLSTYLVMASNVAGTAAFALEITVNEPELSDLSYNTPNIFTVGTEIADLTPTITGNATSYSVSPTLPDGLALDTTTGIISGTPTDVSGATAYTVSASNSGGDVSFNVIITVNPEAPSALSYTTPNVFTVGASIADLTPTITGNATSYMIIPTLPAGLSFDTTTGIISGTPTAVSPLSTYLVMASNVAGTAAFALEITVNEPELSDLSYNTPNIFTVGTSITDLVPTVTGTVDSYSVSPALPNGLALDTTTGIISGTPTDVSGATAYTVSASNSGGDITFNVIITVNPEAPSALSYTTPNVFTVGTSIADLTPTITGNVTSYTIMPTLPTGLSFDTITGVISGMPTVVSPLTTYLVMASNSAGTAATVLEITIDEVALSDLSYATPNIFTQNISIVNLTPTITGNVDSYSVSPALPNGLVLDTTTGIISGTPTAITPIAIYTVTASNSGGSISFDVEITVNDTAPTSLSYNTPNVYTANVSVVNLAPTVNGTIDSYAVAPALPAGLSLDTSTGIISGTPTAITPTALYTVTATNSGGSITADVFITVNEAAPMSLSYETPVTFTVGIAIPNQTPTVIGIVDIYTVLPGLPAGLSLDATTGIISGTPTGVTATATYTITATNSGGTVSFNVVITVNDVAPLALSYTTPNIFPTGTTIADMIPTVTGNITNYSIDPLLPQGLSFDTATGIISGTPTVISPATTYTVTAANSGGSVTFDLTITIDEPLLVDNHSTIAFEVYPNPFTEYIYIKGVEQVSYTLFSVEGKLIQKGSISESGIELRSLPNGMYLLQLTVNGATETKKILKK